MDTAFFDDGGGTAILIHGVASEAKKLVEATAGGLFLPTVADDAHGIECQVIQSRRCRLALQRPHQTKKGGHRRKAMRQRARDRIGALHAQMWQHDQVGELGWLAHVAPLAALRCSGVGQATSTIDCRAQCLRSGRETATTPA